MMVLATPYAPPTNNGKGIGWTNAATIKQWMVGSLKLGEVIIIKLGNNVVLAQVGKRSSIVLGCLAWLDGCKCLSFDFLRCQHIRKIIGCRHISIGIEALLATAEASITISGVRTVNRLRFGSADAMTHMQRVLDQWKQYESKNQPLTF
jgi:hypothetical protein